MQAPDFWTARDWRGRLIRALLTPFGVCYSMGVALKSWRVTPMRCSVPVVCVGNLTAGGVGKTPIVMAIGRMLMGRGLKTFFLSRGYGGRLTGPIRVMPEHHAADVGDEPLLLARRGPTIVSRMRARGGALAVALGAQAIVMDDGHQNFTLAKDLSLVVVDARQGFANGKVLPAGPLRESVGQGLKRADAVILVGAGDVDLRGFSGPVLRAHLRSVESPTLRGARVLAFAGIGHPEKFFSSLAGVGADVVDTRAFGDHHVYSAAEMAALRAAARQRDAFLVTTEKDYVRLSEGERQNIAVLPVEAVFEDPVALETLLGQALSRRS